MSITRLATFRARHGAEEALHTALLALVPLLANAAGSIRVRVLSSLEDPAIFVLYEEWTSLEAHRCATDALTPDLIGRISSLLSEPMKGNSFAG